MKISMPFGIPFDIVGHRPGEPVPSNAQRGEQRQIGHSLLPLKIVRRRPAWANRAGVQPHTAFVGGQAEPDTGRVNIHSPSSARPSHDVVNTNAEMTTSPIAQARLQAELRELEDWLQNSPPEEHTERREVAERYRACLINPQITGLMIRDNGLSSLPPVPSSIKQLHLINMPRLSTPLDMTRCSRLKGLTIGGACPMAASLNFTHCESLISLTIVENPDLTVAPDISGCPNLRELDFSDSNLSRPPDVSHNPQLQRLELMGCLQLTAPPDISHSTNLISLDLSHCPRVASFPALPINGQIAEIDMRGAALSSIPDHVLQPTHGNCRILINGDHFSDAVRNRLTHVLNSPNYIGPDVGISMAPVTSNRPELPLADEVSAWRQEAPTSGETKSGQFSWSELPANDNVNAFNTFLSRIRETSDYRRASPELKQATQQRVADLLDDVENDDALREDCFNLALEAVDTCGDRIAKGLMDMEMQCLLRRAERAIDAGKHDADPQPLVNLLKGQKRLNIIADEVGDIVAGMHFVDDIEAHIGALIKLKDTYDLPIRLETMLYPQWSVVTDQHITALDKKLCNKDVAEEQKVANDQGWQQFLGASPLIQKLLSRLYPAEMTAIEADISRSVKTGKEQIGERLEQLDPASAHYAAQSKELMREFNALEATVTANAIQPLLTRWMREKEVEGNW